MTVMVTEDYGGYFEFRLCADKGEAERSWWRQSASIAIFAEAGGWIHSLLRAG